ncbi:MAG: hypothetical protein OXG78_03000 [Chloroflexi bacterium]|nr:hypothetical protein [Chloroflexota bacterium]
MQLDTTLSLDVVIAIIAIFVAVWLLNRDIDSKISDLRRDLKADNTDLRKELKADIVELRKELNAVESKVDGGNQRLARLEGVILSREGLVDAIVETGATG